MATTTTMSQRIAQVLADRGWIPADLSRKAKLTTAGVAQWMNDGVQAEHVKAFTLFRVAEALEVDPRWLLLGESAEYRISEGSVPTYSSDIDMKALNAAIEDAITSGKRNNRNPPPDILAQMISILYGHYIGHDSDGAKP